MVRIGVLAALFVALQCPASAQFPDCASISNPAARLECYDRRQGALPATRQLAACPFPGASGRQLLHPQQPVRRAPRRDLLFHQHRPEAAPASLGGPPARRMMRVAQDNPAKKRAGP
jgi:hypothetical protein